MFGLTGHRVSRRNVVAQIFYSYNSVDEDLVTIEYVI